MRFRKHLSINDNLIQVFQEDNGHYIIQYQMDKMPKERRTYASAEELCQALEKYVSREEVLEGLEKE